MSDVRSSNTFSVVILNDDVNTFDHVESCLCFFFPDMQISKARELSHHIHHHGHGEVWRGKKKDAYLYSQKFYERGLTVAKPVPSDSLPGADLVPFQPLRSEKSTFAASTPPEPKKKFRLPRKFSLTRIGKFFIGITILVSIAAFNTGNNALYLMFSLMLSLILISGILSETVLQGIRIQRQLPQRIFANQEVILPIKVENTKRTSSYSLLISERFRHLSPPSFFILQLHSRQEVEFTYRITFPRRGVWRSQGFEITTTFPFELFRKGLEVEQPTEILVFPRPMPPAYMPPLRSRYSGEIVRPIKGNIGDFHSLREYRTSDSIRQVHWKISAKRDQLVVRELEGQDLDSLIVCFYNSWQSYPHSSNWVCKDPEQHRNMLERGVETCAGLLQHLIQRGHSVALATLQDRTPYGNSALHMEAILKVLARLQFVGEPDSPTPPRTLAFDLQPQDRCILMAEGPAFPDISTGQVVGKIPFG